MNNWGDIDFIGTIPNVYSICAPTMNLRWSASGTLQQAFAVETHRGAVTVSASIEWRDVPTEAQPKPTSGEAA